MLVYIVPKGNDISFRHLSSEPRILFLESCEMHVVPH